MDKWEKEMFTGINRNRDLKIRMAQVDKELQYIRFAKRLSRISAGRRK